MSLPVGVPLPVTTISATAPSVTMAGQLVSSARGSPFQGVQLMPPAPFPAGTVTTVAPPHTFVASGCGAAAAAGYLSAEIGSAGFRVPAAMPMTTMGSGSVTTAPQVFRRLNSVSSAATLTGLNGSNAAASGSGRVVIEHRPGLGSSLSTGLLHVASAPGLAGIVQHRPRPVPMSPGGAAAMALSSSLSHTPVKLPTSPSAVGMQAATAAPAATSPSPGPLPGGGMAAAAVPVATTTSNIDDVEIGSSLVPTVVGANGSTAGSGFVPGVGGGSSAAGSGVVPGVGAGSSAACSGAVPGVSGGYAVSSSSATAMPVSGLSTGGGVGVGGGGGGASGSAAEAMSSALPSREATVLSVQLDAKSSGYEEMQELQAELDMLRRSAAAQEDRICALAQELQAAREGEELARTEVEAAHRELERLGEELRLEREARDQAEAALATICMASPHGNAGSAAAGLGAGAGAGRTRQQRQTMAPPGSVPWGSSGASAPKGGFAPKQRSNSGSPPNSRRRASAPEHQLPEGAVAPAPVVSAQSSSAGGRLRATSKGAGGRGGVPQKDEVDLRLKEFLESGVDCGVSFRKLNRCWYAFHRSDERPQPRGADRSVEITLVNGKLMARLEPSTHEKGWNNGKLGPIERFCAHFAQIEVVE